MPGFEFDGKHKCKGEIFLFYLFFFLKLMTLLSFLNIFTYLFFFLFHMPYIKIDINECISLHGKSPCQDKCINLPGSYKCTCDNIPGTKLSTDGHSCVIVSSSSSAVISQQTLSSSATVVSVCPRGYYFNYTNDECEGKEG